MHFKRFLSQLLFIISPLLLIGQQEADSLTNGIWKLTSYGDLYLGFNQNLRSGQKVSDFQFNHNRIRKIALNQGAVGIEYSATDFRFNFSFHKGTYVTDNYSAEPSYLQPINRAFAGFKLNNKKNIWLDVGVFPSYIGFESVNTFDNATLTRSLLAENSPYFLTGIRVNYPVNIRNELSFFALTGWQRIVPQKNNSLPSLGWQWIHTFQNQSKLNWSFWTGSDHPDSSRKWRYFNNFYWQGKKGKWTYTIGLDIGMEQKAINSSGHFVWHSPVLITQYSATDKWRASFRMERYADPHQVITKPANGSAVNVNGQSFNVDFLPNQSLICRIEWRSLQSKEHAFFKGNEYTRSINYITTSVAYQISNTLKKNKRHNHWP